MNLIPPELNSYEFKSLFEFNSCDTCLSPFRPEIKELKELKEFKECKELNPEPELNSCEFNSPRIKFI